MHRSLAPLRRLSLATATLALVATARAQCQDAWTLVATSGPPASDSASLVYDAPHAVSVLFVDGQTWEWNGLAWQLVSTSGPSPRTGQAMTFDPLRSRVVLFGGRDATTVFGDTWEWNGTSWTLASSSGPPARRAHALAFHGPTSRCVLYGGYDSADAILGDTWSWDGVSWAPYATTTTPGPRALHAMTRSVSSAARVLLMGGTDGGDYFGDVWRLNASGWALDTACALMPHFESAIAHDSLRRRNVLFGGYDYDKLLDGATYESIVGGFSPIALDGPSPRKSAAMTYDSLRDRVVLFGGMTANGASAETWEFRPVSSPGAPANVVASEVRKGVVSLTWSDGVPAGSGARVERDRFNGASWSNVVTLVHQSPSSGQQFDVPGIGAFRYRVQASACGASSPWSADVVVLPAVPNSVAVTRSGATATVRWVDGSDFEASFEVQRERRLGSGWGQTTTIGTPPANATSIPNAISTGQWRFRLRARNAGGFSAWSGWVLIAY